MGSRKKSYVVGSVLVLIIMFSAALFIGNLAGCRSERFGNGGFHPSFCGKGFPPRFLDDGFPEFVEKRVDEHVEELGLSESQQQDCKALRNQLKTMAAEGVERRREFFNQIRDEMDKENPDVNAIAALVKTHINHIPATIQGHVDLFVAFYNILDDNQRATIIERARKRIKFVNCLLSEARLQERYTKIAALGDYHDE
jgi:hypothetical protein